MRVLYVDLCRIIGLADEGGTREARVRSREWARSRASDGRERNASRVEVEVEVESTHTQRERERNLRLNSAERTGIYTCTES